MDARMCSHLNGLPCPIYILVIGPRKAGNLAVPE